MAKDISVAVEKYTNAQGEEKTKYVKVGVILQGEHGEYALLDPSISLAGIMMKQRLMNPQKASGSVMAGIFDNSDRNQAQNQASQAQGQGSLEEANAKFKQEVDSLDDTIPF